MKKELTVIIPFLNEGIEVANTLQSIRKTAGDSVEILLINDNSTDGFDYETVALQYNAQYHQNEERKGVAASRDLGVSMINTPYFLLLDGHMRFYQNDWVKEILKAVKSDERAIYCCKCKDISKEEDSQETLSGAYFSFFGNNFSQILQPKWITQTSSIELDRKIPCILGASYVASVKYWQYLLGLSGLRLYGSDEAYISLKAWLEGGSCKLIDNVVIGHLFRKEFPYKVTSIETIYNKLLISEILIPSEYKLKIFSTFKKEDVFDEAYKLLIDNREEIIRLKQYYKIILTGNIEQLFLFNESFV